MAKATTLYHSAFVQMGEVTATIKSDVLKSKYKDKPDYVELHIDGTAYYYNVENHQCGEFFKGQKGRTFVLQATGSRDDADIQFIAEGEASQEAPPPPTRAPAAGRSAPPPPAGKAPPPARAAAPSATRPAPTHETPEQRVNGVKVFIGRRANGMRICMDAADYINERYVAKHGEPMSAEQYQAVTSSLFISGDRAGQFDNLPAGPLPGDATDDGGAQ